MSQSAQPAPRRASLLRRIVIAALAVVVVALIAAGVVVARWAGELPDYQALADLRLRASSRVLAADGTTLGTLVPTVDGRPVNRVPVTLDEVSPEAVAAVVGSEDRNFYSHHGFDPRGLLRSLYSTLVRGERQGGSTLTAQLVRSTILENEGTLERKVKELILSVQVDRFLTKDEILTAYLNTVFWGGNVAGIGAAAQAYFGKDAAGLSLAEGVYLAALLPAPNPRFRDLELVRAELIPSRLDRLVEDGRVTAAQAQAARQEPLEPRGWTVRYDGQGKLQEATLVDPRANVTASTDGELAPHFLLEVRKILRAQLPAGALEHGGLVVRTGLDPQAQRAAERAARDARLPASEGAQLALAAVDPATGEVRALVGGLPDPDGELGEFDRAVQSRRSPGSSVKPFLFAAALERGLEQWSTFDDAPLELPDRSRPDGVWRPKNFDGTALGGPVSLRYALDHSLNLPAVRVGLEVGMGAYADKLRALGLDVLGELTPAATLGGGVDASALQMASAYASFVNGGEYREPSFVRRVEDAAGRVLYEARPETRRVWSPEVAFLAWDLLRGVVNDPAPYGAGYADAARLPGREVGGKTGTSSDQRDLWFVGLTPGLSAAVWIGRDDAKPMSERMFSGTYNPAIWADFAASALEGRAASQVEVLGGIAFEQVAPGVRMAYREGASEWDRPGGRQPDEAAPRGFRARPRDAWDDMVDVLLDLCASPPVLASAATDPACAEVRRVPAADLSLYEPPEEPVVVEPDPNAMPWGDADNLAPYIEDPVDPGLDPIDPGFGGDVPWGEDNPVDGWGFDDGPFGR